ncbi:DUF2653 family protein [Bacillus paranthracis]|uniref:DUF2653 family protein n=1 Tax=Bacillus paranthracis TaxID=2026186 RepID=UPI003557702E
MILFLNEQEITDGICVYVANEFNQMPQSIHVVEIGYNEINGFTAVAKTGMYDTAYLRTGDIVNGIMQFLNEYHNFNANLMSVELKFDKKHGFSAEVAVNE